MDNVTRPSDLQEVSRIAISVWRTYKEAPEHLKPISQELASLHIVLKEAENEVRQNTLGAEAHTRLEALLRDTRDVLEDLELFRVEVMSVSYQDGGALGIGSSSAHPAEFSESRKEDLEELRVNVASNTNGILDLIGRITNNESEPSTSRITRSTTSPSDEIEAQLGEILQQKLRRRWTLAASHASEQSSSSTSANLGAAPAKRDMWKELFDELRRGGVSTELMNDHREQIIKCYNGTSSDNGATDGNLQVPQVDGHQSSQSSIATSEVPSESGQNSHKRRASRVFTSHWRPLSFFFGPMMIDAAKTGDIEALKTRLRFVNNIDAKDSEGHTALYWASMNGHTEAVEILIKKGADIAHSHTGEKALNVAAQHGHIGVVRCLLEHGIDVDSLDVDSIDTDLEYTPLLWAATRNHAEVVEHLLDKGAKTHYLDDDDDDINSCGSALFFAASNGNASVVDCLLDPSRVPSPEIGQKWKNVVYDITAGSFKYKMGMVQVLLKKGRAHIDDTIDRDNRTPLHIAVDRANLPLVAQILDTGADIEKPDKHGMTALHKAVRSGRAEMVQLLLLRRADIAATTSAGSTALHMAVHHPPLQTATFDSNSDDGTSGQKSSRIVELLLEYGADVFKEDDDGKTPLDYLPNSDPQFTSLVTALLLAEMERVVPVARNNRNSYSGVREEGREGNRRGEELPRAYSPGPPAYEETMAGT